MASFAYYAGDGLAINNLAGSGIGFYGTGGFGYALQVGVYNSRTYITDSTGATQGPEADNNKYLNTSGVILGQASSGLNLLELPNYQATLNIRFSHTSAVVTRNAVLYGYDRVNKNNAPSGVTFYAADVIHPHTVQTFSGSGDANWISLLGSGATLALAASPGTSGHSPNGASTSSTIHDWYIAMTATPSTVGAKTFGLYLELEYL